MKVEGEDWLQSHVLTFTSCGTYAPMLRHRTHIHTHTYTHTCILTNTHTHAHKYKHMHTCAHRYTHAQELTHKHCICSCTLSHTHFKSNVKITHELNYSLLYAPGPPLRVTERLGIKATQDSLTFCTSWWWHTRSKTSLPSTTFRSLFRKGEGQWKEFTCCSQQDRNRQGTCRIQEHVASKRE